MKFFNATSLRRKSGGPYFLYAAPDAATCAAFFKESRMKFFNATSLRRKSGNP